MRAKAFDHSTESNSNENLLNEIRRGVELQGSLFMQEENSTKISLDETLTHLDAQDDDSSLATFLRRCLPDNKELDRLVSVYLNEATRLGYPLSFNPFHRCVKRVTQIVQAEETIQANDIDKLAVVFAMLSIGTLCDLQEHQMQSILPPSQSSRSKAQKYHHACMRCNFAAEAIGRNTADQCLAWHLASRSLFLQRRIKNSWQAARSAITVAHSIGLHKKQQLFNDSTQLEERRLLWATLFYDERTLAIIVELPSSILDDDDDDERRYNQLLPQPSMTLSADSANFVRWRTELAVLIGKVLRLTQGQSRNEKHHLAQVLALDEEIASFRLSHLPNDDLSQHFDFVHRFMIHSHCLQVRITLLRPYFLRTLPRNASMQSFQGYRACRIACAEAACRDLTIRETLVQEINQVSSLAPHPPPHLLDHIRTLRWFASLIICGIFLITSSHKGSEHDHDLDSKQESRYQDVLEDSKKHLERFLHLANQRNKKIEVRDKSLESKADIIQMFLQKVQGSSNSVTDRIDPTTVSEVCNVDVTDLGESVIAQVATQNYIANVESEDYLQDVFDSWFRSESFQTESGFLDETSTNFALNGMNPIATTQSNIFTSLDDPIFWER